MACRFMYKFLRTAGLRHSSTSFSYRTHTCGELRSSHVGSHVTLCGWMQRLRVLNSNNKGVCFIPLSDATGTTQVVLDQEAHKELISSLTTESVLFVEGVVAPRPDGNTNTEMPTGEIEINVIDVKVLNHTRESLPFRTFGKSSLDVGDELKLQERFLEIRKAPLREILRLRSRVSAAVRTFLLNESFIEVETPTLFKSTPEGAREYIVPTREKGMFYSLVQSPQQFKQLLMVGGIDRYFQFARCYRDESTRSDRQPEFTQIDIEMSFTTVEHIMKLTESLINNVFTSVCPSLSPPLPYPVLSYSEAMNTYGTDKPDTRYGMKFEWFTSEGVRKPGLDPTGCNIVGFEISHKLLTKKRSINLTPHCTVDPSHGSLYLFYNGKLKTLVQGDGPSISDDIIIGSVEDNSTYLVATYNNEKDKENILTSLGRIRSHLGKVLVEKGLLDLVPQYECLWVTGFPLFTEEIENGELVIQSCHHPFTAPLPEHEHLLYDRQQLTKITGQQYDLVVNGWEVGGGSIRIHNPSVQEYVIKDILRSDTSLFNHLMRGLESGCPPHGGIALGLDRLIAILSHTDNIRHVIAFPKSINGRDLMGGAPSKLTPSQLESYHISLINN